MVKKRKNDTRKMSTTLYLDTGGVYRSRPQYHGNTWNKQSSQFNNFHRWENPNQPRKYGRYDRPGLHHNTEYHTGHNSGYGKSSKKSKKKKKPSRPSSPLPGSEEHMKLKIDQTSAIIMRHLLTPDENIVSLAANHLNSENEHTKDLASPSSELVNKKASKVFAAKKKKKKLISASSEEIHDKIMHHLSNLNDGKKRNLINSSGSVYDETIQRIVKQKRIEISRALRSMCGETYHSQESTDYINSIIPDIGIKIEDLPKEILQELQSSFEIDIDSRRVQNFTTIGDLGSTTILLLDSEDDLEEEQIQPHIQGPINDSVVEPQIQGQFNNLVGSTSAVALNSESNFEGEPTQPQVQDQINYPVDSTTHIFPNSENNFDEEPVQLQIQGQIPRDRNFEKSDLNDPPYTAASDSDAANLEIVKVEKECENSTVGEVPDVGMNEPDNETESEPPLASATFSEVSEPESEPPLVSATATEVSEVFQHEPRIENEPEPDIPSVCISACRVSVEDEGRNARLEDSRNITSGVQHETENSSQLELPEDGSQESRMLIGSIHSEDGDNLWNPRDRSNDCQIRAAIENECTPQNTIELISTSTQTSAEAIPNIKTFLEKNFPESPQSLQDAVKRMMVIDTFISELVKYRQCLFSPFSIAAKVPNNSRAVSDTTEDMRIEETVQIENTIQQETAIEIERAIPKEKAIGKEKAVEKKKSILREKLVERQKADEKEKAVIGVRTKEGMCANKKNPNEGPKNRSDNSRRNHGINEVGRRIGNAKKKNNKRKISDVEGNTVDLICYESIIDESEQAIEESPEDSTSDGDPTNNRDILDRLCFLSEQNMLQFQEVREKMLVLKVFNDTLLAATETGKIFFCSLEDGHYTQVLEVTKVPITSLLSTKKDEGKTNLHIGSFENSMKVYDFESQCLLKSVSLTDSVQCMDEDWGYIFLGCMRGTIIRYCIKKGVVEYEEKFTNDTIFVIKTAKEGVRRVLLIGSRNAPVVIRAAMTGLHLRTMENTYSHTVYSLIIEKNLVYCGTPSHNILVFNFHDGTLSTTLKASESKGIGCLKIVGKLLFASCHNGKIYVYNVETNKFIDSIDGPGGVILSMEVLDNQVVVGTMAFKLASIPIPQQIMKQIY